MKKLISWIGITVCLAAFGACAPAETGSTDSANGASGAVSRMAKYTPFRLTADLSHLSADQRKMVGLLIEAARPMDDAFWKQAYGDKDRLLSSISDDSLRRFAEINYGPWDRLDGDASFVPGVGAKPLAASFYPADMTVDEFEAAVAADERLKSLYTMVRRDDAKHLVVRPYNEFFAEEVAASAGKLREAAKLAADPGLRKYLELRADALLGNEYRASDLAWMDMKNNVVDVVIGPIETYEDQLFGYKSAFEAYVLIKDLAWSERLSRYAAMLPELQRGIPVPAAYKSETPGTDSDLNAYDVVYYAGHCNAGSKTIAINLPNDEEVQLAKGTRRLQLKNAMQAKFDKILEPIAGVLIVADQRKHVTFDAFFSNTMFHEVAHGLGIKETINGRGKVREALKNQAGALEEGKADVLGLYMVTRLHEKGELGAAPLEDYYVTFLAGIFRSVRFGASSAHGRANMIRFNYFEGMGAFTREPDGAYRADMEKMKLAVAGLSEKILRLQGDGDYEGTEAMMAEVGIIGPGLQSDLDRLDTAGIPVDITFEQGPSVLKL